MQIEQKKWTKSSGWSDKTSKLTNQANLVLVFSSNKTLVSENLLIEIKNFYPQAIITGCSTAGEIYETEVLDDSISVTAVYFEKTKIIGNKQYITNMKDSFVVGQTLAKSLDEKKLAHVFVLSDGLNVNGSELVKGIKQNLPDNVGLTGGLAADGDRFKETKVIWDNKAEKNAIIILGFYGDDLVVNYGSVGGWKDFGPERLITKSDQNILYELDGNPVLDIYKQYLGHYAKSLPATGLLFPLSIRAENSDKTIVRTLLAVDHVNNSMTFAGDMPVGYYARLMKTHMDGLIEGAIAAANLSKFNKIPEINKLAILISCVGRRLVLKQRTEEEIEEVKNTLGNNTFITGFYSYGEISPFAKNETCELHNQTMTITNFYEK